MYCCVKLIKVNYLPAMLKAVLAGLVSPAKKKKEKVNNVHFTRLLQSFLNRLSNRPKNVYLRSIASSKASTPQSAF
jgi:hypothetical protein